MFKHVLFYISFFTLHSHKSPYYFAIAADSLFYEQAVHLIGTLHKTHFNDIGEIALFDLGLENEQREVLNNIAKVNVYTLITNTEHMLVPYTLNPLSNKQTRGHYTWKCAVLKQALELFPYCVYIDAGISVVGRLDDVFSYIERDGYFFIDSNQYIEQTLTSYVRNFFIDDAMLFSCSAISANFMGISRKLLNTIVAPLYTLAQDLALFVDDGTAPNGYGWSRHDQTILSILIARNNLNVIPALSSNKCSWVLRKHIIYSREAINVNGIKPSLRYKNFKSMRVV